jgi:hypothetical protein
MLKKTIPEVGDGSSRTDQNLSQTGGRGLTSTVGWKSEYLSPRRQERKGWKKRDFVLRLFSLGDPRAFARDLKCR